MNQSQQLRQGQDVLFVQPNNETYPAKLIRQGNNPETWNILVFAESGVQPFKNIPYSEHPQANHFILQGEQGRAVGSNR